MTTSTIVRRTKTKWFLATNELYDRDNGEPNIDWKTLLAQMPGGTKHQRSYLLKSVQSFMDAFIEAPRDQKRSIGVDHLAHGTVLNWYWEVQKLVIWMTERDIWRFSSLTSEDLYSFMEERSQRSDGSGPVSKHTRFFRTNVLRQMWMLRSRYLAPLRVNPLALEAPMSRAKPLSSWKAIEEEAAVVLLNDALNWIQSFGTFIVKILDKIWAQSKIVGLTKGARSAARTLLYQQLEHEPEVARLRSMLQMPDKTTYQLLRAATTLTYGACSVIMLFLIGFRIGEFARLDHNCVIHTKDSNGVDVIRVRGIAAKQGGRERSWIACKEIEDAVNLLLRITSNARNDSGRKALWLAHQTGTFFQAGRRLHRTDSGILTNYLKRFAFASFRSGAPPIKRIHPHAARKTFARFVVTRNKSGLGPLARHFGHISSTITDGSYAGYDIELQRMLSEEGRIDLANNLMNLLSAPRAAGKAADAISRTRSLVPGFKGKKGLKRLVEKLIDDGVQLAPCDWGYCVYSQALSACHGDSRGPNETHRSPDVCSTCSNFAATEQHRPWWEARLSRDEEFLKRPNLTKQTIVWVQRRRANSEKIVADLLPRVSPTSTAGH